MQVLAIERLSGNAYIVQNDSPFPFCHDDRELALRMIAAEILGMGTDADISVIAFDIFALPVKEWIVFEDGKLIHRLEKISSKEQNP